jgi:hypothetical protein
MSFDYVEANQVKFENNLKEIRPMIDEIFNFEQILAESMQMNSRAFANSESFLYLRSGLIERWNTLNEFQTYPGMIKPLKI